jgi:hypothetical protein
VKINGIFYCFPVHSLRCREAGFCCVCHAFDIW